MDLDDLLGSGNDAPPAAEVDPLADMLDEAPPAASTDGPGMDMDDLLGGADDAPPPPPAAAAAAPAAASAASPSKASPTSPSGKAADAAKAPSKKAPAKPMVKVDVPKMKRLPTRLLTPPTRVHPLQLKTIKDPPAAAKPYLTNTAYYVNAISIITADHNFLKHGILINDSFIYIMSEDAKVVRTIPIYMIEAVFVQDVLVVRVLGTKKEWSTQIVIHVREGPDLYFSIPVEKRPSFENVGAVEKGERSPTPPPPVLSPGTLPFLPDVLVALLKSFDIELPVGYLKEGEWIHQLVKWSVSDAMMRHSTAETLAHRFQLSQRLQQLIRTDARLIVTRNKIESSGASATTAKLINEIQVIEAKNEESKARLHQIATALKKSSTKQKEISGKISAQEKRCAEIVADRIKDRQSDAITKHALEFELTRATHQSEVHHFKVTNAFLKTCAENGKKTPSHVYNTPALVQSRLHDLQVEWAALQRAMKMTEAETQAVNEARNEARERLATGKANVETATKEITELGNIPEGDPLPEDFNRELAETLMPVRPVEISEEDIPEVAVPPPPPAAAAGAAGAASSGAPVALSDDDDDVVLPPPKPAAGGAALALSDDDDVVLPPPKPAAGGAKIVLDDDDDL